MTELDQRVRDAFAEAYGFITPTATVEERRRGIDALPKELPEGIELTDIVLDGVPVRWVTPKESTSHAVALLVHGGGFHVGGPASHRDLAAHIALASGAHVAIADYGLTPETVFPVALNDVKTVYRGILAHGVDPKDFVLIGDSSGAGLGLAALLELRDEGVPMPAGLMFMSAWVDQSLSSDSVKSRAGMDPYQNEAAMTRVGAAYRNGVAADDPRVSPIFGDFTGLPPMLLQVGTHEPLHDDTLRLAEKARAAGIQVEVQIEEGMPHMHQMLIFNLPEAVDSARRAGEFIRTITGGNGQ